MVQHPLEEQAVVVLLINLAQLILAAAVEAEHLALTIVQVVLVVAELLE
jgi:hypothetical protein